MKQSAIHIKDRKPKCVRFRSAAQHITNPLHIFCRLSELGANKKKARNICTAYEKYLYKPVLG